jgi:hypothetical protein
MTRLAPPRQLDHGQQLALLLERSADRCGFRFGDYGDLGGDKRAADPPQGRPFAATVQAWAAFLLLTGLNQSRVLRLPEDQAEYLQARPQKRTTL